MVVVAAFSRIIDFRGTIIQSAVIEAFGNAIISVGLLLQSNNEMGSYKDLHSTSSAIKNSLRLES